MIDLNAGRSSLSITSAGIPSAITKIALCVFCAERSFINNAKTSRSASINFMLSFVYLQNYYVHINSLQTHLHSTVTGSAKLRHLHHRFRHTGLAEQLPGLKDYSHIQFAGIAIFWEPSCHYKYQVRR